MITNVNFLLSIVSSSLAPLFFVLHTAAPLLLWGSLSALTSSGVHAKHQRQTAGSLSPSPLGIEPPKVTLACVPGNNMTHPSFFMAVVTWPISSQWAVSSSALGHNLGVSLPREAMGWGAWPESGALALGHGGHVLTLVDLITGATGVTWASQCMPGEKCQ